MKILVTGPESTGKSKLAKAISEQLGLPHIPEYAREYLSKMSGNYTLEDVLAIALRQSVNYLANAREEGFVMDSHLINIKIWLKVKFDYEADWIDDLIKSQTFDHVLLCSPDIPWEPDPLRESPHDRERLFDMFEKELQGYNMRYHVIRGVGEDRLDAALQCIRNNV